jgi:hypothetical protein
VRFWKYALPKYNQEEKNLIKAVLFEHLVDVGMLAGAVHEGRDYFRITDFGKLAIGD